MRSRTDLYHYQQYAISHILSNKGAGLLLDMGLGKTVCTLTAVEELMYDRMEIGKVLVIAPKLVAQSTWVDEVSKWEHLKHLRISVAVGTEKQRIEALETEADLFTINRENVDWLVKYYKKPERFPFDMVVIDELSSFKSPSSKRFKALRKVRPYIDRVVGLTGTFNPNGYLDVWSQVFLLDNGVRLGTRFTEYRSKYFSEGRRNGMVVYEWKLRPEAADAISEKIADICISMKSEDYLELPERVYHYVKVRLPSTTRRKYAEFEKESILELTDGKEVITAASAGVLVNKLLQFANGAVYDDEHQWHEVHTAKLEALKEMVEASTSPVMIAYAYEHDVARIQDSLKEFDPKVLKTSDDIRAWNSGQTKVLLVHPASAGHGHNLQFGGHTIIWFGNTFNLELYLQLNKRLHRQGQQHPVQIYHLITEGTYDEDVITALSAKEDGQLILMEALKARIKTQLSV